MIQRAEPWMSDRDIEAGQRWNEEISARLMETDFGIICLTPENINAPWLLFEAGALAKAINKSARVVPVLLGFRKADLTFPLAQFQAVESDREGFFALVSAINGALDVQLEPTILNSVFGGLWPNLESNLRVFLAASSESARIVRRSDREVLEDVLESIRTLQRTIGSSAHEQRSLPRTKDSWEEHYMLGVNLVNRRGDSTVNLAALRSYNEAIALVPPDLPRNTLSRLYAYRGAILKRLGRLEEAENDLVLARKWATEKQEIEDALYNTACINAMSGRSKEALANLRDLLSRDPSWRDYLRGKTDYFGNLMDTPEFKALLDVPD